MNTKILNLADLIALHAAGKLIGLFNVEEEAYHAGPGVPQSMLKEFGQSPAHAKAYIERKSEPTQAMKFGTAVHCSVLEPSRFASTYVQAPECDRRTKAGKETYAAWESENQGKNVLDQDDMQTVKAITAAVNAHEAASTLTRGLVEMAAYWIDEETGILCRCKADAIVADQGVILDLKTTSGSATQGEFARSVANYGYHIQAAYYLDGVREALRQSIFLADCDDSSVGRFVGLPVGQSVDRFVFMVVEKGRPYGVALFELDAASIQVGRNLYRKYLQELAICRMENHWPAYSQGIQTIQLPSWANAS